MVTPLGMVMVRLAEIVLTRRTASPTALGNPNPTVPASSVQLFGLVQLPSASTRQLNVDGTVRSSRRSKLRRARRDGERSRTGLVKRMGVVLKRAPATDAPASRPARVTSGGGACSTGKMTT